MSPPPRPPIPLQMAGGRAQPGSLRRPGTPTPLAAASSPGLLAPARGAASVAAAGFEFTFEAGATVPAVAPPTFPARFDRAEAVSPSAGRSRLSAAPARVAGGLYGQAYVGGSGHFHYEATTRMDTWLCRLEALSLERQGDGFGSAAVQSGNSEGEGAGPKMSDARVGEKRSAPTDGDEDEDPAATTDLFQPAAKRNRLATDASTGTGTGMSMGMGSAIQRTLSRMGRNRANSAATANNSSRHRQHDDDRRRRRRLLLTRGLFSPPAPPAFEPLPTPTPASESATQIETATTPGSVTGRRSALGFFTSEVLAGISRPFTPFGGDPFSSSARAGPGAPAPASALVSGTGTGTATGTGATADAAVGVPLSPALSASAARRRTLKMCLVGDVGVGKTAFVNRLTANTFVSPPPTSAAPNVKSVNVRAGDGSLVNVELWDFPASVARQRGGPLLSSFFHAAIICFDLEDKDNLAAVSEVWKPKLDASLHDGDIFVLGTKRDLRPAFPTLNLAFLPTKEPVTSEMGIQAAERIRASGYGECSARTDDNVWGAFEGIVNYTLCNIAEHERSVGQGRRRARARSAVATFFAKCGLRRLGRGGE